jgi:GldM C-terminal domain
MVTKPRIGPLNIRVIADVDGKQRDMGSIPFRVKPLPKAYATLSGISTPNATKGQLAASPGVLCSYGPDFEFNARPMITGFTLEKMVNGFPQEVKCSGARFNDAAIKIMNGLKKGERITITNITATGADGRTVTLDPITFRVL